MIVILIPSHFEAKTFVDGVAGAQEAHIGGADFVRGKAGGTAVTVGMIGMGLPHAPWRAEAVIKEARGKGMEEGKGKKENTGHKPAAETEQRVTVRGVILAGFAGALEPGLKRGDIFITAGAEFLLPHLPEAGRPRVAKLATVEKIAGTAAAKQELFERTGAALCDMEQTHVAAVAQKLGLPFIGVRIVSDEAQENLPADTLEQAYDQQTGTYTPWKLAGHLTRNPLKTLPLASFVRLLPPIRNRMSDCLHTWLRQAGPRLFG